MKGLRILGLLGLVLFSLSGSKAQSKDPVNLNAAGATFP